MPRLYIANCSAQEHIVSTALTHQGQIYNQIVAIGAQVQFLDRDLKQEEIDYFVRAKERYGYRHVKDLKGEKNYIGIAFSVDAPINLSAIKSNYEHNDDVLTNASQERQQDSAVAIASMLSERVAPAPTPLKRAVVELVEETQGEATPRVAQGTEYVAEGVEPRNFGKRAGKRR